MRKDRQVEILAPAGSFACFQAAMNAGADAVYAAGARFGARAYANNFTQDELIEAIERAHIYGKKFYLTVNTLLKDHEIAELYDYLAPLYEKGLDAVIVQDTGVFQFIRGTFPDLEDCYGEGDTLDEAIENANAAAFDWITLELSEEVPELPAITDPDDMELEDEDVVRNIQVNIRLYDGWDE